MLDSNSKVLVTGGTGFTGRALIQRLLELGCNVRAIARASSNRPFFNNQPVQWIIGDVYDEATVKQACEAVDYIFHVAAAYRLAGAPHNEYRKVHVDSTRLLAKYGSRNNSLRRFVHVSTVGVHGHIQRPPADEATPINPGDNYQSTKSEAELWIRAYARTNDLPLTVIRPAAIYGPGDMRLLKLFKIARLPIVPLIGFTNGVYHLIHVDDLVAFMLCAAEDGSAMGEIYICGNEQPTSIREIVSTVAARLGTPARFFRVPAWPFFGLAYTCEWVCSMVGVKPLLYPRRVAFFTKDRAFDTRKMRSLACFKYAYTNDSGIAATCDWYQKEGFL